MHTLKEWEKPFKEVVLKAENFPLSKIRLNNIQYVSQKVHGNINKEITFSCSMDKNSKKWNVS